MATPKDPKESNETDEHKWDFKVGDLKIGKSEKTEKSNDGQKKNTIQLKSLHKTQKSEYKLELDHSSVLKSKTRSALAFELDQKFNNMAEDSFTLAPLPKRAIAFILDFLLMTGFVYFIKFTSTLISEFIHLFMGGQSFKLMISEAQMMNLLICSLGFLLLFFFVVIPVAFFNTSFGKKLMGLRIRGIEKYTISISTAFKRELILKPISIFLVAGFITPFISKKCLSIHDMLAETIVIED